MSDGQAHGAKKTKGQDYTACLAFLPEGVWSRVMKASTDRQRAEELVHFCSCWRMLLGTFEDDWENKPQHCL